MRHSAPQRFFAPWWAALAVVAAVSCLPVAAAAQSAGISIEVDERRISTDDQITVRVTARGEFGELTPPTSDGFDFESTGRSTQVSIVGSRMQRSEQYTWVGAPRRAGKWKVGPVIATYRGKEVARSEVVEVEVLDGRAAMGPAVSPDAATDLNNFAGEAFFVRPVLSTTEPYAGQPFVVEFQLFWSQHAGVQNIGKRGDASYGGLAVEDLLAGKQPSQEPVRFAGRRYMHQVVAKVLLTAATAGRYEIVGPRFQVDAGDIFSTRSYKIAARPMAIAVRGLPEQGRPASYQPGAIGRLRLRAHLLNRGEPVTSRKLQPGERTVLSIEVEGMGNLLALSDIAPPEVAGMAVEKLPSRPDEGLKMGPNGAEGKRTWQYLLSFASPGRYEIPAIAWGSFDPFAEKYEEHAAGPFVIEVQGPPAGMGAPAAAGVDPAAAPPGIQPEGQAPAAPLPSLRPIAPRADLAQRDLQPWTDSPWFWRLAGLPWIAFLLLVLLRVGLRLRARTAPKRQMAGALGLAHQELRQAGELAPEQGYGALQAAVDRYFERRAGVRIAGLTWQQVRAELARRGAATENASSLTDLLEHCDFARFAPGGNRDDDLGQTAVQIAAVLQRIDAELATEATPDRGRGHARAVVGLLLCALTALTAPDAVAATLDEGFATANKLFIQGRHEEALDAYEALLEHGVQSPEVHYNISNALVKLGRLGAAVGHYKHALRLEPGPQLAGDITHNLSIVRGMLSERARKRHRILHIFDESPELAVAVARAAPHTLLGLLALGGGFAALLLWVMAWWRGGGDLKIWVAAAMALLVHLGAAGWLWHAQRTDADVRYSVVIAEDAPLAPCVGVGETVHLPEGLEVRTLHRRPDGRYEVRLPNGRSGCMRGETLYGGAHDRS